MKTLYANFKVFLFCVVLVLISINGLSTFIMMQVVGSYIYVLREKFVYQKSKTSLECLNFCGGATILWGYIVRLASKNISTIVWSFWYTPFSQCIAVIEESVMDLVVCKSVNTLNVSAMCIPKKERKAKTKTKRKEGKQLSHNSY